MYEKVMEIIVLLMKRMQDEQGQFNDIGGMSQVLVNYGYTQQEVNTAFAWLFERLESQAENLVSPTDPLRRRPNRVLHVVERLIISPEAHGLLIQLRELGLIDDAQTEGIIERAMLTGARTITRDDILAIAASMLINPESSVWTGQNTLSLDYDDDNPKNYN
jgi:uncharacterized protein Smg (DUF494 family)